MKRRVIQIANSTQLISLPRKWSQKYGIKKGDELEVEEDGDKILVKTETAPASKEIEVDVTGLTPKLADRFLARAYQKGYDKITVKFDKPEIGLAIQEKVNELLGFEIMDQSKTSIVISSISSKLNIDFDTSLRRAFLIVLDMAKTCESAYREGDNRTLENLYHKDFDVNKFCYFCLRFINKGFHGGFGTYILYYLIEMLEDVGDEYKALAIDLTRVRSKNKKPLLDLMVKVYDLATIGYEFFYKPEKIKAVRSMNLYIELRGEIKQKFSTRDSFEASVLNSLDIISRIMYHFPTMRLDTLKGLGG
jgi:phosphate uptake regulator